MKQVEQMLRELEQNAQRKIAVVNGMVILAEDRPKYEAILKLKAFVEDNQNIFRELNSLAGAAGVEVDSLVSGYEPKETVEKTIENAREDATQEQVVIPNADDIDYTFEPSVREDELGQGYFPEEVSMGGEKLPTSGEDIQVPDVPASSDEAESRKSEDDLNAVNSISIRDFLNVDNIDIALKYPENKVEVYHALNTWVATNVNVPMGYICYARVNEVGNADVFLGKLENFSWDEASDKLLIEKARKDLVIYYDTSMAENIGAFEAKHSITRVDQMSLPINITKKKLYASAPYFQESDVPSVQEQTPIDVPPVDVPAEDPRVSEMQDEVSLSTLLPDETLTIEAKIPGNKYSIHDGLRKWLSENVMLPDGYALYVTVSEANEATIYLGKKSMDVPLALHELKTANVENWERINGITRIETKNCQLVVNSAIRDNVITIDATTNDDLSSAVGAGPLDHPVEEPEPEPEKGPETRKVVGRRLTEWASSFSKNQTVRRGINFLNKLTGKSPLYINYMDGISALDLNDPNIFDKLGVIVNNFERDKVLFVSEAEKAKIKGRLDRVVSLAQDSMSMGR